MRYFLELCIKSVQAAITYLDAEIIVVDNNSSDDSCEMVKGLFPNIRLIENEENFGFSKGNNIGVAHAKGEYLCVLNPDTVVAEDTFRKILEYAEGHPNTGILGCQLIDGRGQFLPESKRNIPTPKVAIQKMLGLSNAYYANHVSASDIDGVNILVGAFMFLKRNIYEEVCGFDEDYFMYGEDIDLSYKVLKAGYQNVYYGKTTIIHYKGESTLKDKTYAKQFYGAMQIFYNKHFKSNLVFDMMIWMGIRFSRLFVTKPKQNNYKVESHILVTKDADIKIKLPFPADLSANLNKATSGSQVVFDGNTIKYKEMIDMMASSEVTKRLTFRILSKDAHYIIGSDSSEQRGEVIFL